MAAKVSLFTSRKYTALVRSYGIRASGIAHRTPHTAPGKDRHDDQTGSIIEEASGPGSRGKVKVRCRIEKIFGTWKRSYGFGQMRWRGLANARPQTHLTEIAYNLKRTFTILKPA